MQETGSVDLGSISMAGMGARDRISEKGEREEMARMVKLEREMASLQQQHSQMLSDLHREVEVMKNKNRGGLEWIFVR